ncbi:heme-binding protein [Paenibacillus sp. sptzw28]|uniref:GlcG/HbpS family heme-binding protein n=1 Tax=Paenibacillus sp. sptzw28 TaxID=715179 RepID=UPI0028694A16|nr:heme-binding protein [Paenibacillus sp. sptzw28]
MQLWMAKEIIQSAELEAHRIGVPMVISVVDAGGNLTACYKMDHALLASIDIATNKAWTSVAMKMPTADLAKMARPGGSLYGIHSTNRNRIVLFGGGIPLLQQHLLIGGLGVSGGSVEQDVLVAEAVRVNFERTYG